MQVTDLIVEVRNASFARVGQIMPVDLVGFTSVLRFRKPGTWEIPLRSDSALAEALRAPGAGIVVTGPNGVLFSGPTRSASRVQSQEDPQGTWIIRGITDEVILGERLAYATPTTADVTAQTSEYDVRTGKASTIMCAYVNANIGPSAPVARKISNLTIAADPNVGSTITGKARFETLGSLLESLAVIDGLGFGIKQSGSNLQFSVYQPTDRSSYIRMDIDNNMLTKSEYTYTAPEATRVIVAGGGKGTARTFVERTSTASTTAETAWGRRIEVFKDQRSTSVTAELQQAGDEVLVDKGKTLEAISVSPSDDSTMAFGVDWYLGDKVSVVAGTTTIVQVVTEVGISVAEDGVRIGATVGAPSVADDQSEVADVQADQEDRITNLEVNASTNVPDPATVTTAMLVDEAVTSAKIADGTIMNADINASAAIATSKIAGLDTALAAKAPIADPTFTGTATAPVLRLTSTTDASTTSTAHPLQIGATSGANLRIDNDEIFAINNGAPATLYLQLDGGTVSIGYNVAGTLAVNGNITATGTLVADDVAVSTGVATAASGWTVASALFRKRNGVAMLNLGLTRTGATITAGNITNVTACTLNAGFRPIAESAAISGPTGPLASAYINAAGSVVITALGTDLASGSGLDINATFILA